MCIRDSTVVKHGESREHARSVRLDKVLTGKYTGIPIFLLIMLAVFWLTFGVIGTFLSDVLSAGIDAVTAAAAAGLDAYGINPVVRSLVIDGVFAGVGSVLSFLPIIVTLFFFLSMLEDSGYMARVAFVMDKLLRKIGLSGRSFVPMLIGFGCSAVSYTHLQRRGAFLLAGRILFCIDALMALPRCACIFSGHSESALASPAFRRFCLR